MAEIVTMPKLGFDMAEGTLIRWVVNEGEQVTKGAVLAEIETDKATVEVESTHDGVIAKHLVPAGEIVPVNTPIAVIAGPGESVEEAAKAASAGEAGEQEAPPADITVAAATPGANPDAAPMAQDPPGAAPAMQTPDTREAPQAAPEPQAAPAPDGNGSLPEGVRASPLARRMAQEMRINLQQVPGSGPGGRITRRDIETFLSAPAQAAPTPAAAPQPAAPAAAPAAAPQKAPPVVPLTPITGLAAGPAPDDQSIPLNRLRAAIGRRMVESKQQAPHFYVTREYDVAALMELRKQVNAMLPDEEKISVNDFIMKAAALTLRQFPNLNAALQGDQIVRRGAINIGMAVAVENGLLTVVIRDADRKPLRQIAVEAKTLAGRAREGKVKPDDIEGSTFSTSNLGMYGVEDFVAILNPPEAGILAIGGAREVPVVKDGQIAIGWRMKATISVDHRVSDGAEGARYMQALADYIEQPLRLLV